MSVIENPSYRATREMLKGDPIIVQMAEELRGIDRGELVQENGSPRSQLVVVALNTYHERGGNAPTHIGGPAEAIVQLLDSWEAAA